MTFLSSVTVGVRPGVMDIVRTIEASTAREAYRQARSVARWHARDPVFGYLVIFDVNRVVSREARKLAGRDVEMVRSDMVRR